MSTELLFSLYIIALFFLTPLGWMTLFVLGMVLKMILEGIAGIIKSFKG